MGKGIMSDQLGSVNQEDTSKDTLPEIAKEDSSNLLKLAAAAGIAFFIVCVVIYAVLWMLGSEIGNIFTNINNSL